MTSIRPLGDCQYTLQTALCDCSTVGTLYCVTVEAVGVIYCVTVATVIYISCVTVKAVGTIYCVAVVAAVLVWQCRSGGGSVRSFVISDRDCTRGVRVD